MNEFYLRTMVVYWSRPRAYNQSGSWNLRYYFLACSAEALEGGYTVHLADRGKDTCKSKFQCGESKIWRIKPWNLFGTIIPSTLGRSKFISQVVKTIFGFVEDIRQESTDELRCRIIHTFGLQVIRFICTCGGIDVTSEV